MTQLLWDGGSTHEPFKEKYTGNIILQCQSLKQLCDFL